MSTARTPYNGWPQALRKPVGSKSLPGAFQDLVLSTAAATSSSVTTCVMSNAPESLSAPGANVVSCMSLMSMVGLGKNFALSACPLSSCELTVPSGIVKLGSLGGSTGTKLLHRAHFSSFHSSPLSLPASCIVVLQALVFAYAITFACFLKLLFILALSSRQGAPLYSFSACLASWIAA